jgi:hypothetical protein
VPRPQRIRCQAAGAKPLASAASDSLGVSAGQPGADRVRHRHDVVDAEAFEGRAKCRGVAVGGIGDHRFEREPGGQHPPHVGDGDAPLFPEGDAARNVRPRSLVVVRRPIFRQIQLQRGQPREAVDDQRRRHGHLAIGDLPECAAVLALHADRGGALLRQAGVVDGQDPVANGNQLAQSVPERARV